jgi:hypothetical protein
MGPLRESQKAMPMLFCLGTQALGGGGFEMAKATVARPHEEKDCSMHYAGYGFVQTKSEEPVSIKVVEGKVLYRGAPAQVYEVGLVCRTCGRSRVATGVYPVPATRHPEGDLAVVRAHRLMWPDDKRAAADAEERSRREAEKKAMK